LSPSRPLAEERTGDLANEGRDVRVQRVVLVDRSRSLTELVEKREKKRA
jgi:hypothetical protein